VIRGLSLLKTRVRHYLGPRLTTFSGTISGLNVNNWESAGSTMTRTQWLSGAPNVSTRVKFSNDLPVLALMSGLSIRNM
jgi:hypothetical protein